MFYLLIVQFRSKDINKTIQMFFEEFAINRDCLFWIFFWLLFDCNIRSHCHKTCYKQSKMYTKISDKPKNTRDASIKLLTIYAIFLCVDLNQTK